MSSVYEVIAALAHFPESYGIFATTPARPTNLDAAVIELNADYLSWVVPKSHISPWLQIERHYRGLSAP